MNQSIALTSELVVQHLRALIDPELCLNVVDLGMVEAVRIADKRVEVDLLLTSPGCPLQDVLADGAREIIFRLEGVDEVEIYFPATPVWTPDRIDAAALEML